MWSAVIEQRHNNGRPNGLAYHVHVLNHNHLKYYNNDVQHYFDNQCIHYATTSIEKAFLQH